MTIIRNFKHLFSSLLLAVAIALPTLPAMAQLDPRLQTTKTDFLDLFQQSASLVVKPEMLTLFDFSGSMHAMYWDKRYYANATETNHADQWGLGSGDWYGIVPVLDPYGKVYLHEGTGYFSHDLSWTAPNGVDNTGTGRLIQPDGTVVPLSGGTYTQAGLTALVKLASHVRISATTLINGVSVTRTMDLPIPWVIMNQTVPSVPTSASSTITFLTDPRGGPPLAPGPSVEPDRLYLSTNPNNIVNDDLYGYGYYKIGRLDYNYDFLWWVFFGMDTRNATNDGSDPGTKFVIPAFATTDPSLEPAGYPATTWNNKLQGFTRFQALKYAVVKTWFARQDKVWWGYRFLDGAEDGLSTVSTDNGSAAAPSVSRDIRLFRTAQNPITPDAQLKKFLEQEPQTSTPLTYGFGNSYAQLALNKDASSSFGTSSGGGQSGTENPIPSCRNSFMVAFTDGQANDQYGGGSAIGTAADVFNPNTNEATAQTALNASGGLGGLAPGTSGRFNIWTLAGVAAHYSLPSYVSPTSATSYPVPTLAPFNISDRGATTANKRRIRTMTVAMSVAGSTLDATSGKADLFRAALYGNPNNGKPGTPDWDKTAKPYDPNDSTANDKKVNPFFFDATDPDKLVEAIKNIVDEVTSSIKVVSTPVVPFVGLGLANQIYLGSFLPPSGGGPVWSGDLQMFATITNADQSTSLVDASLTVITTPSATNAQWAAANIFTSAGANRPWHQRKAWTRIPASGSGASANPGLIPFTDVGTSATNPVFPYFATALTTDAAKQTLIQTLLGAKAGVGGTRTAIPNNVTVLGDIVDSTPNVAEYDLTDSTITAGLAAASPYLSGKLGALTIGPNVHFRLIFVGDNLGFLHAFGELTYNKPINATPGAQKVTTGWVDELWTYYPTDFLKNADYNLNSANPHRFAVDGSPFVYHLDLPKTGDIRGDKKINNGERALVVFGLRKGGRSYYALDIRDPFTPKLGPNGTNASLSNLGWALVPDEAAVFDATRIETGQSAASVTGVLSKMGFSTSTPAVGRVIYGSFPKLRDVVFLGGGYSVPEVEVNFANALLGRSTLALDVLNGDILGLWDLSSTAGMGPVSSGVVPFEFFPNSGLVQRAYFSDFWGGLWALGSAQLQVTTAAPNFGGFRLDSSALDRWTSDGSRNPGLLAVRKIYSLPKNNSLSSSLPAPFTTANFPITRDTDPKVTPAVVGIAMVSGDRNNPLDMNYNNTTNIKPIQHRLTVIWDRQDSELLGLNPGGITDSRLVDMTGQSTVGAAIIDPSNASYYLKASNPTDKVGYYANFPAAVSPFVSKGISQPIVLSYVLIYSYFSPTKFDPCTGGTGNTLANRVCNVVLPVINTGQVSAVSTSCTSGNVLSWIGVASEFSAKNNIAALQGGNVASNAPPPPGGGSNTVVSIQTITGNQASRFPKPRVWRVVR